MGQCLIIKIIRGYYYIKETLGTYVQDFSRTHFGIVLGIVLYILPPEFLKDKLLLDGLFKFAGDIFISSLKMMLIPVVFTSLTAGAMSIKDVGWSLVCPIPAKPTGILQVTL